MLTVDEILDSRRFERMCQVESPETQPHNYMLKLKKRAGRPSVAVHLEAASDENAIALASQRLEIKGELTTAKFKKAGGLSILRDGEKIFPT